MKPTDEMVEAACEAAWPNGERVYDDAFENPEAMIRAALEAALSRHPAGVKVKPLEWSTYTDHWAANSPVGYYQIRRSASWGIYRLTRGSTFLAEGDVDELKAAAESDHSTRILSSLETEQGEKADNTKAARRYIRDWCPDVVRDYVASLLASQPSDREGAVSVPAAKLLAIRDALAYHHDMAEAYHILYGIASPEYDKFEPWAELERLAATSPTMGESA
jgi:hypothetical protein